MLTEQAEVTENILTHVKINPWIFQSEQTLFIISQTQKSQSKRNLQLILEDVESTYPS